MLSLETCPLVVSATVLLAVLVIVIAPRLKSNKMFLVQQLHISGAHLHAKAITLIQRIPLRCQIMADNIYTGEKWLNAQSTTRRQFKILNQRYIYMCIYLRPFWPLKLLFFKRLPPK